jgi:predicted Zn finger-like uncharacterized protein
MPFLKCPQCDSQLELDAEAAGMEVQCGHCQHLFTAVFPVKKSPSKPSPSKRIAKKDEEEVEAPPKRSSSRREEEDEEDERPAKKKSKRRVEVEDEDDDYEGPRKKPKEKPNGMGIASMICGIVGLVVEVPAFGVSIFGIGCCCFNVVSWPMHALAAILAIVAVSLGLLALKVKKGKGMTITGIALGGVTLLLAIASIILGLLGFAVVAANQPAPYVPPPYVPPPQPNPFPVNPKPISPKK